MEYLGDHESLVVAFEHPCWCNRNFHYYVRRERECRRVQRQGLDDMQYCLSRGIQGSNQV